MIASRILLIPVIAAVGYEILRLGARHPPQPVVRAIMYPGHPGPDDHDQAPDRRHDRGRDRLDGGGARGRRQRRSPTGSTIFERDAARAAPSKRRRARGRPRRVGGGDTGRAAGDDMSDLDAKLAEIAAQYDDVQAQLARPEVTRRPERDPPARPRAGPARAHRRGLPDACRRPATSSPARASCATRATATTRCGRWRATRSTGSRPTRRACSRSSGSCCCRATRTTTAT